MGTPPPLPEVSTSSLLELRPGQGKASQGKAHTCE